MDQGQYPYVECGIHTEQIDTIQSGIDRIDRRMDEMARDVRAIATHAEAISSLKERMTKVEEKLDSQQIFGRVLAGIVTIATGIAGWLASKGGQP